jgi:DNA-directed RNA polymerase specialized sigma24 family protein
VTVAIAVMDYAETDQRERLSHEQFERFYARTMSRLRFYICRVASNEAIADDILQESYIRLLNAPPMTERERKSYLYRVATNLITDHWRAENRRQRWWGEWFRRATQVRSGGLDLGFDVWQLFALASIRDRALLWLAYVEEADHQEIATTLHLREMSVKVLLHRARRRMEAVLRKHGFEESDG